MDYMINNKVVAEVKEEKPSFHALREYAQQMRDKKSSDKGKEEK